MKLDPARSRVAVYTFAEGLLSALAHDLEIVAQAEGVSGEAADAGASAELKIAVASLRVRGVMKRGKLDTGVLSAGDRATIEKQITSDVLPGAEVVARGTLEGTRASIEVVAPRGTARVSCPVAITKDGGATRVKGEADVSTKALGAPPVKGPMGAFRVKDQVKVEFDLVFA
jgi:hypothetical protein